jgi:hypothetical protein
MFLLSSAFVAINAHSLAALIDNDPQTDILVVLGCLLLVIGTVVRYKLPATQDDINSQSYTLRPKPMQTNAYAATVAGVVSTAGSQRHANVM